MELRNRDYSSQLSSLDFKKYDKVIVVGGKFNGRRGEIVQVIGQMAHIAMQHVEGIRQFSVRQRFLQSEPIGDDSSVDSFSSSWFDDSDPEPQPPPELDRFDALL